MRIRSCLIVCAFCIGMGLLMLSLRTVDSPPNPTDVDFPVQLEVEEESSGPVSGGEAEAEDEVVVVEKRGGKSETERSCATVEEMGKAFHGGFWNESLRVRRIIQDHFALYGTIFLFYLIFGLSSFLYVELDLCLVSGPSLRI